MEKQGSDYLPSFPPLAPEVVTLSAPTGQPKLTHLVSPGFIAALCNRLLLAADSVLFVVVVVVQ